VGAKQGLGNTTETEVQIDLTKNLKAKATANTGTHMGSLWTSAGIRLAVGRALIGIITAEMFTAVTGMGALLVRYSSALATDKFFVPVILLALLGVILSNAVERLQKRLAPWKETERAL